MGIKFDHISQTVATPEKEPKTSFLNKEITLFGNGMSNKAKEQFYAELSVLLNSGIDLRKSLELIAEMQKKAKDAQRVEGIAQSIVAGSSLSQALEGNKHFTPYEYHAVRIGEQTGQLNKITNDLREYYHRKNELRRQLISSLTYPLIVLFTACLVVFFMLKYVVPMFVDIFTQNKVTLPWLTERIVDLSHFVEGNGLAIVLFILGLVVLFRWMRKKEWYYRLMGRLQLKLPVLGTYIKRIYLIQFTQAMALLTNARIPVVTGIQLVKDMIRFYPIERTLGQVEQDIIRGEKLHRSFEKHPIYEKKMIALLKVAEETNQTEYLFQKLYEQYSVETQYRGQILSNIFNFILTLFVGLIVGVILIAMYLPMFKLSSVIG